ncbi:MAG: ribosomal RNA small subunit methyltransferase A [Flavobacteriales bacterium]|nr:ribosomal RNA small subunit methyltransferase A [Flavobacteriales bacterium]HRH70424.1 16S rRNA (adenine(1518)-N(6)/adenine(1519)-N(6))-dimethyltransferase RsmA [Flavobacteriales bacterium]
MHVRAKKHLGQHFLKEDAISQRIANSLTGHGGYRHIIEVGPGTGALTKHLVGRADMRLVCYEVDTESVEHLHHQFPGLEVRESDFLRMDPDSITEGPIAVIGNFPYNISTEIVFKVLEHRDQFPELVGMFQKEVADRFCSGPDNRTYGITSVLAQAWYDMEVLFLVEPEAFIPPPRVRSAVIRMKRNAMTTMPCDEVLFARLVKAAFNQRRKTLHNALKGFPALPSGVPAEFAGKRAEQLSVTDFMALAQACTA